MKYRVPLKLREQLNLFSDSQWDALWTGKLFPDEPVRKAHPNPFDSGSPHKPPGAFKPNVRNTTP